MNLVQVELNRDIVPGSRVVIVRTDETNDWTRRRRDQLLKAGETYTVAEVKTCSKDFECAKQCTTGQRCIMVNVNSPEYGVVPAATCMCELTNIYNRPVK